MDDLAKKINNINNHNLISELENVYVDKYSLWRKVNFSNTINFDPNDYVFFTHSVNVRTKTNEFYDLFNKSNNAYSPSSDYFDIAFNPNDLKKKKRISAALTTSVDNYTYGRIGYIISAPIENILYVGQAPFDKSNDELRRLPLKTPQEAQNDMFHEVVLEGSTIYGVVKPEAIFVNFSGATEEEINNTMLLLEQFKMATGDTFPVLDLSNKGYRLQDNFGKKL